jgi:DNA/RNA-binding protein KIN17
MNATKWATLSDFVQYLGKTGQCVVDETERGWYISLVERDPTKLARQELLEHRAKAEKREEERLVKRLEAQRRHEASKPSGSTKTTEPTNLDRTALPLTVPLSLPTLDSTKPKADKKSVLPMKSVFGDDDDDENDLEHDEDQVAENPKVEIPLGSRKRNRWDASENAKDVSSTKKLKKDGHGKEMAKEEVWPDVRKEHWIRRDIWVRIVSKSCEYYKQKGIVDRISKRDKLMADVEVVVNMEDKKKNRKSHFVKVHQNDLETVIPKSSDDDPMVVIVNGRGRGELATVISMDKSKCRATLELKATGDRLEKVYFEDFSKAA